MQLEGFLLPAACPSSGGFLSVNARRPFCVFSKFSDMFSVDHSFSAGVEFYFLPLSWGSTKQFEIETLQVCDLK